MLKEFKDWLEGQCISVVHRIEGRLSRIRWDGHFGDCKYLKHQLWELKWKNGYRVYYAYFPPKKVLVILGGTKNGQNKDISKAKKLLAQYQEAVEN